MTQTPFLTPNTPTAGLWRLVKQEDGKGQGGGISA